MVSGAGMVRAMAATLDLFRDMVLEQRTAVGPGLIPAVERVGAWTAMHAFEPEANSLYEHISYKLLETTLRASPAGFPELMRLFTRPRSLNDLAHYAHRRGLERFLGIGPAASPEDAVEAFLSGLQRCRDHWGFAPVGEGVHALGPEFVRETFEEAFASPQRGEGVRSTIQRAARYPLSVLTIDRLLHVLQGAEYFFKVRELSELSWDSFDLPSATAFVPGGDLERAMEALKSASDEPTPMDLELGRRLATGRTVLRRLNRVEMESYAGERMGPAVRTDNIRGLRRKGSQEGEVDEILLLQDEGDEPDALHDFVHNVQEERHGPVWISENLMAAEMEAHAWEIHLRRRHGDARLYEAFEGLSPFGFAMGLRLYVEQVYFRLMDVPGIVS
jgi:hypothetical protein